MRYILVLFWLLIGESAFGQGTSYRGNFTGNGGIGPNVGQSGLTNIPPTGLVNNGTTPSAANFYRGDGSWQVGGGGGTGIAQVVTASFVSGSVTITSTNITSTCGFSVMPVLSSAGNIYVSVTNLSYGGYGVNGSATFVSSYASDSSAIIISIIGPGGSGSPGGSGIALQGGYGTNTALYTPSLTNGSAYLGINVQGAGAADAVKFPNDSMAIGDFDGSMAFFNPTSTEFLFGGKAFGDTLGTVNALGFISVNNTNTATAGAQLLQRDANGLEKIGTTLTISDITGVPGQIGDLTNVAFGSKWRAVFAGDSLTAGYLSVTNYSEWLSNKYGLSWGVGYNTAVTGQTAGTIYTNFTTQIGQYILNTSTGTNTVVFLWAGNNDNSAFLAAPQAFGYTNIENYLTNIVYMSHQLGATVVLLDCTLNWNWVSLQYTNWANLNKSLARDYTSHSATSPDYLVQLSIEAPNPDIAPQFFVGGINSTHFSSDSQNQIIAWNVYRAVIHGSNTLTTIPFQYPQWEKWNHGTYNLFTLNPNSPSFTGWDFDEEVGQPTVANFASGDTNFGAFVEIAGMGADGEPGAPDAMLRFAVNTAGSPLYSMVGMQGGSVNNLMIAPGASSLRGSTSNGWASVNLNTAANQIGFYTSDYRAPFNFRNGTNDTLLFSDLTGTSLIEPVNDAGTQINLEIETQPGGGNGLWLNGLTRAGVSIGSNNVQWPFSVYLPGSGNVWTESTNKATNLITSESYLGAITPGEIDANPLYLNVANPNQVVITPGFLISPATGVITITNGNVTEICWLNCTNFLYTNGWASVSNGITTASCINGSMYLLGSANFSANSSVTASNITATNFYGNGIGLTNVQGSNVVFSSLGSGSGSSPTPNMAFGAVGTVGTNSQSGNFTFGAPINVNMASVGAFSSFMLNVTNTSGSPIVATGLATWKTNAITSGGWSITNDATFTVSIFYGLYTNVLYLPIN